MHLHALTQVLAVSTLPLPSLSSPASSPDFTPSTEAPSFTYNHTTFLLNGEPYIIIGGQMDPQRIPRAYWRDRLAAARAMGLNTIFSYVYWNLLEPTQGSWTAKTVPENDVAAYFRIAQAEGLNIVLRPGPYICGEREWGGFPAWLATVPGLVVRSGEEQFMGHVKTYLKNLAAEVRELQVSRGGPLLMVQVENEYGSFGEDHNYTAALRDILKEEFEVPLYTNDGTVEWTLSGGSVPGVLAEIDGDPRSGFAARDLYITDESKLGPLLDGEYYTNAPDIWGSGNTHPVVSEDTIARFQSDLEFVLQANNSISLYMFHGGSNFGFSNGALWKNYTVPFTSSYDYGAPLDESGRTTPLYDALRKSISKYVPEGSLPVPKVNVPLFEIPEFDITPVKGLFDGIGNPTRSETPLTMEELEQAYGFILYEHTANVSLSGLVQPGDRARDRVIVYVNGTKKGVIDSTYAYPANVSVELEPGDKLQLFVEDLGRVDYWSRESGTSVELLNPYKGILGNVTIGEDVLFGWDIYPLPLDELPDLSAIFGATQSYEIAVNSPPVFYQGAFSLDGNDDTDRASLDTFLAVPNGVKGNVWVNGFNLGRYWVVGPQQSLYLPGTVLNPGTENEVVVLELEPNANALSVSGSAERIWGNYDDPDYP
ncbi:glycoside hydrolase family 35 protein [Xylariaceae sp. FL1272]|nr:glycoside hydrolase family 35 protein [Xylariaceae sp. FL1272]